MAELDTLANIGNEMQRKLHIAGIANAEELARLGAKQAYFQLKSAFPEVCLVHLYALQAALDGVPFNRLPEATKRELKAFSDSL